MLSSYSAVAVTPEIQRIKATQQNISNVSSSVESEGPDASQALFGFGNLCVYLISDGGEEMQV